MARQIINVGTVANDNTGDSLRTTATKINANFAEMYYQLWGDSDNPFSKIRLDSDGIIFEGSTDDDYETFLSVINPTADRSITLLDASGMIVLDSAEQTLSNKTFIDPMLRHPDICDSAGGNTYCISLVPNTSISKNINLRFPDLTDSDSLITLTSTSTLSNKTLASAVLTNPTITNTLLDTNGNESLLISATGSAVNHINVVNSIASNAPTIQSTGDDTNVGLNINTKGSGNVSLRSGLTHGTNAYTAAGAISLNYPVALLNRATAMSMTLANGEGGQIIHMSNINAGDVTITPASFGQGTSFLMKQNSGISLLYNVTNGWNLLGIDSDGGLGSMIIIT